MASGIHNLGPAAAERLAPIVAGCLAEVRTAMSALAPEPIQLEEPRLRLVGRSDVEAMATDRTIGIAFRVGGDVASKILLLSPLPLAIALASIQLQRDETATGQRCQSTEIDDNEKRALEEIAAVAAAGLEKTFRESSVLTLSFTLDAIRSGDAWSPLDDLDDEEIAIAEVGCTPPGFPREDIQFLITATLVHESTGAPIGEIDESADVSSSVSVAGSIVFAAALGTSERRLVQRVAKTHGLVTHFLDDVRDLLPAVLGQECIAVILGEGTTSGNARASDVIVASLRRFRAHPRGRDVPALCLMQLPERENVLQVAQLGVLDVVGLPARSGVLEQRLGRFLDGACSRALRDAA